MVKDETQAGRRSSSDICISITPRCLCFLLAHRLIITFFYFHFAHVQIEKHANMQTCGFKVRTFPSATDECKISHSGAQISKRSNHYKKKYFNVPAPCAASSLSRDTCWRRSYQSLSRCKTGSGRYK